MADPLNVCVDEVVQRLSQNDKLVTEYGEMNGLYDMPSSKCPGVPIGAAICRTSSTICQINYKPQ